MKDRLRWLQSGFAPWRTGRARRASVAGAAAILTALGVLAGWLGLAPLFHARSSAVPPTRTVLPLEVTLTAEESHLLNLRAVERALPPHVDEVRRCYEAEAGGPGRNGVSLNLELDSAGGVERAEVLFQSAGDDPVLDCLGAAALSWRFPTPSQYGAWARVGVEVKPASTTAGPDVTAAAEPPPGWRAQARWVFEVNRGVFRQCEVEARDAGGVMVGARTVTFEIDVSAEGRAKSVALDELSQTDLGDCLEVTAASRIRFPAPGAPAHLSVRLALSPEVAGQIGARAFDLSALSTPIIAFEPQVLGGLDKGAVKKVVDAHLGDVQSCSHAERTKGNLVSGRVWLRFLVASNGRVASTQVISSTVEAPELPHCLARAIENWAFPAPRQGGVAVVSYPFSFGPKAHL